MEYSFLGKTLHTNGQHFQQIVEMLSANEVIDKFLLQEDCIEDQLQQHSELVEKQRTESKAETEQLTVKKKEIESRLAASLELLVDRKVPKERVVIKLQKDEQKLRNLQNQIIKQEEIKAPPAEDLEVFRDQLWNKVEGNVDIEKKFALNSVIKKMEANQDGLVEIEFCVARGHPRRVNTFGAGRFQLSSHLAV